MKFELREKLAGRLVVASVSGGKDSAALSLWLKEQGIEHRRVFMDTGWEHPATYAYLRGELARVIGPIEEIRSAKYPGGMIQMVDERGALPSRTRRFCTEELKLFPMRDYLAQLAGDAINAVGVRAEESDARAKMTEWEWSKSLDAETWRPLIAWSLDDVIAIHHRHALAPNPLYLQSATRVGCRLCVCAGKNEIKRVAKDDPEAINIMREKEAQTGQHWFHARTGRVGSWPIDEVVKHAKTVRGGKQFPLFLEPDDGGCMRWGLCDSSPAQPSASRDAPRSPMPNEKAPEPLSEEKLGSKKVCEVCGRERGVDCWRDTGPKAYPEAIDEAACYRLGYERKAAILTPEVLRLIEAGRKYGESIRAFNALPFDTQGTPGRAVYQRTTELAAALLIAARALPFEKPAESNRTEKQQLPKKE